MRNKINTIRIIIKINESHNNNESKSYSKSNKKEIDTDKSS